MSAKSTWKVIDMRGIQMREKLLAGQRIGMINPHHNSVTLASRLVEIGADAIFADCEHGPWSHEDIRVMGQTVRGAGGAMIVRPDSHQRSTIIRYLNMGADGIMVPMVETAEQAQAIVDTVQYACPTDYEKRLVVCMIESAETVQNELDEMLAVEGVDVFFIGPNDLAQSMGLMPYSGAGNPPPPELEEMVKLALTKITNAGKIGGTLTTLDRLAYWTAQGAQFIYYHMDPFIGQGIREFQAKLA